MSDPLNDVAKLMAPGDPNSPAQPDAPHRWTRGVVQAVNFDGSVGLFIDGGSTLVQATVMNGIFCPVDTTVDVLVADGRLIVQGVLTSEGLSVPAARIYVTTFQSIANASSNVPITGMIADTAFGNTGITFASNALTIVTPGRYRVTAALQLSIASGAVGSAPMGMSVMKGGSTALLNTGVGLAVLFGAGNALMNISDSMRLAAGDVIYLQGSNIGGGTATVGAESFLDLVYEGP